MLEVKDERKEGEKEKRGRWEIYKCLCVIEVSRTDPVIEIIVNVKHT